MTEKPYQGMLGYRSDVSPFLLERALDKDDAKDEARKNDLTEYILVPRGDKRHKHAGYIRNKEGKYKRKTTRLAVFRHLLTAGKGEVPSRKDVGLD